MQTCDRARDRDPLGLDDVFRQPVPVVDRPVEELLGLLAEIVPVGSRSACSDPPAALAALRDLDFLLCAVHRREPLAYKTVPGLEPLLIRLGRSTRQPPRGTNTTYALCNPLDDRMRLFTGLREEHMFIRELAQGLRGLDDVLNRLAVLATHPVDSPEALEATGGLAPAWEPMVATTVMMLRRMPPEVFSGRIVPNFATLDIGGASYQGVTGAQNLNIAIDYLIWGVEMPADSRYHPYARTNLEQQLPAHRELVAEVLDRTDGASLLTHIERQLAAAPHGDWRTARTVLTHIADVLRRISTFRAVHRQLAALNLPLRATKTGSGGHTLDLLDLLAASTTKARRRTHALRHAAGDPGTAQRRRRGRVPRSAQRTEHGD
jgi:hypothetical protein